MKRLVVLTLLLASCASYVDSYPKRYDGVPRFEPTHPANVQVLGSEPQQRFDRLGEILLNVSIDPPPAPNEIENKLSAEGGKWGANAVYIISDTVNAADKQRKIVGIAIRFKQ